MSIVIKTTHNKNDEVWVIEDLYRQRPRIIKMKIDRVVGRADFPEMPSKDWCDLSSNEIEISYLLSNGWFAEEEQLFSTLEKAVEAFNNNEHTKFIG